MIAYFLSKLITIFYGMLYPAYCSYKAIKSKDVKEYVHWMMYWIVFSIFSVSEIFADTFIGLWLPFYYELKILFLIWILSPTTRGGSTLYKRFIHPFLNLHEPEIDGYLAEFKLRTSNMIVQWGSTAFSYIIDRVSTMLLRGGIGIVDVNMMSKMKQVPVTYKYENFDQPDMNRNSYPRTDLDDGDGADLLVSDLDQSFPDDLQTRHRIYPNRRYASVDDQLGRMAEMSKPYSMMDLTENEDPPPKVRHRKKKEDNTYGTLPRTKRTSRKPKS